MASQKGEHFDSDSVLAALAGSVVAMDAKRKVTYWNAPSEALFGVPASEAIGRSIFRAIPAKISRDQAADIRTRLDSGKRWSGTSRRRSPRRFSGWSGRWILSW